MFLVESHDDSINSADDSSWWLDTGPERFIFLAPCFILFISKLYALNQKTPPTLYCYYCKTMDPENIEHPKCHIL